MNVDVILISYNQEKYIAQAVESILMQQVNNDIQLRVIIADDCSKDNTLEIIKSYEDKSPYPFIFLKGENNLGHVLNYKRAFEACNGDYVAILEGDDYWTCPLHLQKLVDFLESHKECVLCTTTPAFYYNEKEFNVDYYLHIKSDVEYYTTSDFLMNNCIANLSACLIRNKAIKLINQNIYRSTLLDWIFYISLSEQGLLARLKEITSVYRVHSSGLWSRLSETEYDAYNVKRLNEYNKLLNGRISDGVVAYENKIKKNNKRICIAKVKLYIPPLFFSLLRLLLPPKIYK